MIVCPHKKDGLCAKCAELKPYKQFKTCKKECYDCKECGWFYGSGAGEDKAGRPVPEQERSISPVTFRYTSDSIRTIIMPCYDTYYAKLSMGQPTNWKCDQQTKDNFVISNWMIDELRSLDASETDRHDTQNFFNRKARSAQDLYQVAAKAMNNYLDNTIERYRRFEQT